MSEREEFPEKAKRVIAGRAGYACSNPDCRKSTIGPHSDPEKALSTGIGAHIKAAAAGGPRYDANQPPAERMSAKNGIWVCHVCSDRIDKDPDRYPVPKLLAWKAAQEQWADAQGMIAALPEITFTTMDGLSAPPTGGTITGEMVARFREHTLKITNPEQHKIEGISARMQLPEPSGVFDIARPAGAAVEVKPDRMKMMAFASGPGAAVHMPDISNAPASEWIIEIDSLRPGASVVVRLHSVEDPHPFVPPDGVAWNLMFYMQGHFQYERNGSWMKREFIVPFAFDATVRKVTSKPVEEDTGTLPLSGSLRSW